MCDFCKKKWEPIESRYPCGPCASKWKCPYCGKRVSPCCGAEIIDEECEEECEACDYCGIEKCSKCGEHCHCGGCV